MLGPRIAAQLFVGLRRGPFMLFAWLKQRRRRQLLAAPFPDEWRSFLSNNVPLYSLLTETEQAKLQSDLRVFVAERTWEGCAGLTVTDEMMVTIAAQACLLVLNIEHDYFSRVPSILIYPSGYQAPAGRRTRTAPSATAPAGLARPGIADR